MDPKALLDNESKKLVAHTFRTAPDTLAKIEAGVLLVPMPFLCGDVPDDQVMLWRCTRDIGYKAVSLSTEVVTVDACQWTIIPIFEEHLTMFNYYGSGKVVLRN